MGEALKQGDKVEVWSNSRNEWIQEATVLEAVTKDCVIDGYAIPNGAVKVSYSTGVKWIMPEDVPKHIRKVKVPPPPSPVPSPAGYPVREGKCRHGCGRNVQPGLTRGMQKFDTCCKKCALYPGAGLHDDNCGGVEPEPIESAPPENNPRTWLNKMLDPDPTALRKHTQVIFQEACPDGEDKLRTEELWNAIEIRLLSPISERLHVQEAERLEVMKYAQRSKKWAGVLGGFVGSGPGKSDQPQFDCESFREICRMVLMKRNQVWFPQKLPAKTHSFVRKSPFKIDEVYDFGSKLGEGSFGVVHSVVHKVSGEKRVCKKIEKLKGKAGMKPEEIMQEIESMARLDHPNVIKVYEFYEDKDQISQIMEPCRGGELQDKIDAVFRKHKEPMYSEAFINDVIKQTCRAMAFIHSERFMHKDLKPQNIMLVDKDSWHIKVIDFGLAELFSKDQKVSNQFGGTLLYMAPEVFSRELTMKSDIWSIGVILYNLITGDYPFMAQWPLPPGKDMEWWQSEVIRVVKDPKETIKQHKRLTDNSVSPECINFLRSIFEKDPNKRPDAPKCLEHDWFKKFEVTPPALSVGITQCLEAYSMQPELKKALFLLIAHQSTAPALTELRGIFTHFDYENRGALSEESFRQVLRKSGMPALKVERIVYSLDRDGAGNVCWTEFIAAALCISVCHAPNLIGAAFELFDTDKDQKILLSDLAQVFARGAAMQLWKDRLPYECTRLAPRGPYTRDHFDKYMGSYMHTSAGDALRAVT